MGGEDFGEIDSKELVFTFKPKTQISCLVKLINTSTNHVAYKVKTTCLDLYCVRPNVCIVKPRSTCEVIVTRKAEDVMPLPCVIAKERFMFERAVVNQDTSVNDISRLFRSKEWEKRINKKKVMVVFKTQEVVSMNSSSSTGEDYGKIDSEKLAFTFKPKTNMTCLVKLINTSNNHVAYKAKTTHPNLYCTRPNICILKPGSTCEVIVTRKAEDVMPLPSKEKFMFERAFVSQDTSVNDINTLFHSKEWEKRINKKKLMVVFESQEVVSMKSRMEELELWVKEDQRLRIQELELFVKEDEKGDIESHGTEKW